MCVGRALQQPESGESPLTAILCFMRFVWSVINLSSLVVYREVETRVWEWLDVSVSRDGSVTPIGAFDLGHMKLSDGSPATTALTAALDAPPCDAVEPCISSLPDAPVSQNAHHIFPSSSYFPILMISLS